MFCMSAWLINWKEYFENVTHQRKDGRITNSDKMKPLTFLNFTHLFLKNSHGTLTKIIVQEVQYYHKSLVRSNCITGLSRWRVIISQQGGSCTSKLSNTSQFMATTMTKQFYFPPLRSLEYHDCGGRGFGLCWP